jgi:hypothetical protein
MYQIIASYSKRTLTRMITFPPLLSSESESSSSSSSSVGGELCDEPGIEFGKSEDDFLQARSGSEPMYQVDWPERLEELDIFGCQAVESEDLS